MKLRAGNGILWEAGVNISSFSWIRIYSIRLFPSEVFYPSDRFLLQEWLVVLAKRRFCRVPFAVRQIFLLYKLPLCGVDFCSKNHVNCVAISSASFSVHSAEYILLSN